MKNTLQLIFTLIAIGIFSTGFAQNNCLDFNGTEDYVNCGSAINSNTDNQITISAWVYPEFNAYGDRGIVTNYWYDAGAKGGAGIFAWQSGGEPSTDHVWYGMISSASGSVTSVSSSSLITLNQWTHVAMTYDNNTLRLFVNGEEVATNNCGSGYLTDPTNNNPFYIAKHSYSSFCFNGKIDEVEIWNDARTSQEIRQNMYRELPNPSGETNLVAYYKFNESSGTTLTDSKGSNTGTLTNMAGNEWTASMTLTGTSNALDFDGSTNYVVLDNADELAGLSSLTVEAWVNTNSTKSWQEILHRQDNNQSSNSIAFAVYSGTGVYSYINAGTTGAKSVAVANVVNINEWMHLAVSWQSSDGATKIYVNGEEVASDNGSTAALSAVGAGHTFLGTLSGSSEHFSGKLDEIRLWNDVRTPDELRENMCKELDGTEEGLIGYYTFNQTFGSGLLDISASNNHGTLTNMDDADWADSESFTTWTGTTSSAWATAGNWSDGVPTSTDNVGLYDYGNSDPIIPTGQTVNNMVVGSGVSTQVSAGENLTVSGNLYNYGDFTVASTGMGTSGTGSLIVQGEALGNITFQRYADVYSKGQKWHYISTPVSGQSLNTAWMNNNSIGFTDPAYQFFRFSELYNYWIYFDYVGSDPEDFDDDTFIDARGYCLTRTSDGVLSFSGTPITEDVSYAATYTEGQGNGFNLVGNPFTSAIGITSNATSTENFLAENTDLLDDNYEALYIWDEGADYTFGSQDYKVISNADITGHTSISQHYIAPGQAFMVKVVSGGGDLAFNTNMQTHSTVAAYKSKETWPSVELTISGNETSNTTAIGFNSEMTAGLDPSYDAAKFKGNPKLALYTKLVEDNGKDFAVQALPDQNIEGYEISIGVDVAESGVFEFSATQEQLDNYSLLLEDRQENTFTNLRWDTYFATVSESGTGRFYLHFKDATAIEENQMPENDIVIYAANSVIYIAGQHVDLHGSSLIVTDITGRIVLRREISGSGLISIPVNLETGIYTVAVENGNNIKIEKVFIK